MGNGRAAELNSALSERLAAVPDSPGVYLFRDASARFLYVGKAASLRPRVRSYFGKAANLPAKIQRMMQRAVDFEFFVTHSESEALILENTLIKRHRPPYNTRLRDDKTYPYIKIDLAEEFPLVSFTRLVRNDGARYFGPFASAKSVRRTLDLLKKLFPYRSCTKVITGTDPRPCLEYYINRCVAPCVGYADREDYRSVIDQVLLFLEGRTAKVMRRLKTRMDEAAQRLDYERAAVLRDQIRAVQRVSEEQKVVSTRREDMDVIALLQERDEAWVETFFIRQGKLVGRDQFTMVGTQEEPPGRVLAHFVSQFYDRASYVPPLVLLQQPPEEADLIQAVLEEKRGGRVRLHVPLRGEKRRLMTMVAENAAQTFRITRAHRLAGQDALAAALSDLQDALNLPRLPQRIECYDISNIRGTDAVGSMVVFQDGRPKKAHYRRFKIRSVGEIDDYAMMREVLTRRFGRLAAKSDPNASDEKAWGIVPDLVLIDGGRGHLSTAHQALLDLGVSTDVVPLASIAKQREELFALQSAEPILLPRDAQALFLVQQIRDEAHRFAISYHQKLRSRRATRSALDQVSGIGPKRRRMLIRHFGSLQGVRRASLEELASLPGMTRELAQRIKELT